MKYRENISIEIIAIGDELLIGQTVDTNSGWIGEELNKIGLSVKRRMAIADTREDILWALNQVTDRCKVVLVTGGLGPTGDDVTKKTICEFFNSNLVEHKETLLNVKSLFERRGITMPKVNIEQALVPDNCQVLGNPLGTAPGLMMQKLECTFVFMPGVPYEMKGIMKDHVLPRLEKMYSGNNIVHKTILTQGIGESSLMEKIAEWEKSLEKLSIKLAYLPSPGRVKLRMTAEGVDRLHIESNIQKKKLELYEIIQTYIYGEDDEKLEELIGLELKRTGKTISTAESCTGGALAKSIISVPGSSAYFLGSIIAYSNQIKCNLLNVNKQVIQDYGAVSEQVSKEMALNILKLTCSDYAISSTGIAGPDGGTSDKPVGTVWITVCSKEKTISRKFIFGKDRNRNIEMTINAAFNLFRKEFLKI